MKPFTMTPAYDRLLRGSDELPLGLHQLQVALPEQLTRLHYRRGSLIFVKTMLKTLTEQGYVRRLVKPTATAAKPYYYLLGPKGVRYLISLGLDAEAPKLHTDAYPLFLEHQLELNDLVIAAALLARVDSRYYLHRYIPERVMKREPYKVSWSGGGFTIIPDGFLDFGISGTDLKRGILLEHDRGTEEQDHFRRRIRAYCAFLGRQACRELLGVENVIVAFSTFKGPHRLEQMRAWTKAELDRGHEQVGWAFVFAALERPPEPKAVWLEPCWLTVYDGQPQALLAM